MTITQPQAFDSAGMYGRRARFYDAIYHWKPYEAEAARLRELLAAEGVGHGARIIEAACGTGSHLLHLRKWYEIEGFDISPEMIELARGKLPDAELFVADMTDFSIDKPADALLCLFSSIGYIYPEDRLGAAARCFAKTVRDGGVIIIEPWLSAESFVGGVPSMHTYSSDDLKLCRSAVGQREGEMSSFEFHWLVAERGAGGAEHFVDRHALWHCPMPTLLRVFDEAGFDCRLEPNGLMKDRGLIIGRRK